MLDPESQKYISTDEYWIRKAIAESVTSFDNGGLPFGAILVDVEANIALISTGSPLKAMDYDAPLRRAEMEVLARMTQPVAQGGVSPARRAKCILYTSTEPCVMCGGAIFDSGIGGVVFGCTSHDLQIVAGPDAGGFSIPLRYLYSQGHGHKRRIVVRGPILEDKALSLHEACGVWEAIRARPPPKEDKREKFIPKPEESTIQIPQVPPTEEAETATARAEAQIRASPTAITSANLPSDPTAFLNAANPNKRVAKGRLPYVMVKAEPQATPKPRSWKHVQNKSIPTRYKASENQKEAPTAASNSSLQIRQFQSTIREEGRFYGNRR